MDTEFYDTYKLQFRWNYDPADSTAAEDVEYSFGDDGWVTAIAPTKAATHNGDKNDKSWGYNAYFDYDVKYVVHKYTREEVEDFNPYSYSPIKTVYVGDNPAVINHNTRNITAFADNISDEISFTLNSDVADTISVVNDSETVRKTLAKEVKTVQYRISHLDGANSIWTVTVICEHDALVFDFTDSDETNRLINAFQTNYGTEECIFRNYDDRNASTLTAKNGYLEVKGNSSQSYNEFVLRIDRSADSEFDPTQVKYFRVIYAQEGYWGAKLKLKHWWSGKQAETDMESVGKWAVFDGVLQGTNSDKAHNEFLLYAPGGGTLKVKYVAFFDTSEERDDFKEPAHMYINAVGNAVHGVADGNLIAEVDTDNVFNYVNKAIFAIYNEDMLVDCTSESTVGVDGKLSLVINNFETEENAQYTAKVFLWDMDSLQGECKTLARHMAPQELVDFVIEVPSDRSPVILQLSDPQTKIKAGEEDTSEAKCYSYLRQIISDTLQKEGHIDLIYVAGDMVYGKYDTNNGEYFRRFVNFMEEQQIPWAPVFGNHDPEHPLGADWMCDLLEDAEYCLFRQRNITGNGNYSVGIVQGGDLKRVFFFMDTNYGRSASQASLNNGHTVTTAGFIADQISWYTDAGKKINSHYPNAKIAFGFHVSPVIFKDAFAKYGFRDVAGEQINIDTHTDKVEGDFGFIGTNIGTTWDTDYSVYKGMRALNTDLIMVGHIHSTSASVVYNGIRFQFGQKSSTYDELNYILQDGTIVDSYDDTIGEPIVGGTVVKFDPESGSVSDAYIQYASGASSAQSDD